MITLDQALSQLRLSQANDMLGTVESNKANALVAIALELEELRKLLEPKNNAMRIPIPEPDPKLHNPKF